MKTAEVTGRVKGQSILMKSDTLVSTTGLAMMEKDGSTRVETGLGIIRDSGTSLPLVRI
jgi:hypothetical protein